MEIPAGLIADTQEHALDVLSTCFINDPFQRYFVYDHLDLPDSVEFSASMNNQVFEGFFSSIGKSQAMLVTVPGSAITSVWALEDLPETDEEKEDQHAPRILAEVGHAATQARRRVLSAPCKILHLWLVANDRSRTVGKERVPSIRDVMNPMLAMAKEKEWVVCLDATSAHSRDVYKYLGFDVIEELCVGKDRVDSDGRRHEGGSGFPMWVMMYR